MSLKHFAKKHHTATAPLESVFADAVAELDRRVNGDGRQQPVHIPDQRECIADLFDTDETVWLFFFDAGRYDFFDQLVWDYFDGPLQRVWNGGVGYTGDWCVRNLSGDYGNRGVFSYLPLRGCQDVEYDDREHFAVAPDPRADIAVMDRLAALGYRERAGSEELSISPNTVNESVRQHKDTLDGGVIRYLKPHPPFEGYEDLTSGTSKTVETRGALHSGDITYSDLADAYRETYRVAFEHAAALITDLDGRVFITADHGTCLTCGQLYHGRHHDKHDHLTVMPWFEVDRVV